jgi:3D (Asp-Asp-Asp) domain-containing protein
LKKIIVYSSLMAFLFLSNNLIISSKINHITKEKHTVGENHIIKKKPQIKQEVEQKEQIEQEVQENKKIIKHDRKTVSRHTQHTDYEEYIATAYCSCVKCCGKNDGITKMGTKVRPGVIAVDSKVIPLGTKVHIEGMGEFVAEDIGGSIKGKRVDIYMETHNEALKFGRQTIRLIKLSQ